MARRSEGFSGQVPLDGGSGYLQRFGGLARRQPLDHLQHVFQSGVGSVPESDDIVAGIRTFLRFLLGL